MLCGDRTGGHQPPSAGLITRKWTASQGDTPMIIRAIVRIQDRVSGDRQRLGIQLSKSVPPTSAGQMAGPVVGIRTVGV
jgi:hypothetical protein